MIIQLFGITKEIIGNNKLQLEAGGAIATVGDLKRWLAQQYPALQQLRSVAIAVNSEYAGDEQPIENNSEIALIPPVSGG